MTTVLRWRQTPPPLALRWRGPDSQMAAALAVRPNMPLAALIGPPGGVGPKGDRGDGFVGINGETPVGAVNGVNLTYTLAHAPLFLVLFVDGVRVNPGAGNDYILAGNLITMLNPLQGGQVLSADYLY
jgi:hypothetical protein